MASFRKLQNGEWGVGLDSAEGESAMTGKVLVIERKDGTKGRAVLGDLVTGGAWGSIWTIAPKVAATPPAAPAAPAAPVPAAPAALPVMAIKVPAIAEPKRRRKNKEV